jgi:phosphoribosylformylglycinamidine cyclo-ligase
MAHITGGGITDNLPRVLPRGTQATIELSALAMLPIFRYLRQLGSLSQEEMLRTFNCGAGMILLISPRNLPKVEAELKRRREKFCRIGHVTPAASGVRPRVVYSGSLS